MLQMCGRPVDEVVSQLFDTVKTLPEVQDLPVIKSCEKVALSRSKINEFVTTVGSLSTPCVVLEVKHTFAKLIEASVATVKDVIEYHKHLTMVSEKNSKELTASRKSWRNAREAASNKLKKVGVPNAIARNVGSCLMISRQNPGPLGIPDLTFKTELSVLGDGEDGQTFSEPKLLVQVATDTNGTHWHRAMARYLQLNKNVIEALVSDITTALSTANPARYHALKTAEHRVAFEFNPVSGPKLLQVPEGSEYGKCIVGVQENNRFDVTPSGFPLGGAGVFLCCVSGVLHVTVCTQEFVLKAGADLPSYLARIEVGLCEKLPQFILKPNQACWVPFGAVPCIVGLCESELEKQLTGRPSKKQVPEVVGYSGYCLIPPFDMHAAGKVPIAVVTRFLADHVSNSKFWPSSLVKYPGAESWKAKLVEREAQA